MDTIYNIYDLRKLPRPVPPVGLGADPGNKGVDLYTIRAAELRAAKNYIDFLDIFRKGFAAVFQPLSGMGDLVGVIFADEKLTDAEAAAAANIKALQVTDEETTMDFLNCFDAFGQRRYVSPDSYQRDASKLTPEQLRALLPYVQARRDANGRFIAVSIDEPPAWEDE